MVKKCLLCGKTDMPDDGCGAKKDNGYICSNCGDHNSVIVFCRGCGYCEYLSRRVRLEFDAIDVIIAKEYISIRRGTLMVIDGCSKCNNGTRPIVAESFIIEETPPLARWN